MTTSSGRHEPLPIIESYFAKGVPGVLTIEGAPPATLHLDPGNAAIAIRVPASGAEPDLVGFRNLTFDSLLEGTDVRHQLSVVVDDNIEEAYAWLCSVLDRVQLAGEPFAEAIETAVDSLEGLVALRRGLTRDQQVGLFGELIVLAALADGYSPSVALSAWRGPLGEEHDFGTQHEDLEVKTTLSEQRLHWISGAAQLVATGDRPLYVMSVQLTAAAVDAGRTLPELVRRARRVFTKQLKPLNRLLDSVGYKDSDAALYRSSWDLRTPPAFFRVDESFPALTPDRLSAAVPSAELVVDVRYRVDLTARPASTALFAVARPADIGVTE